MHIVGGEWQKKVHSQQQNPASQKIMWEKITEKNQLEKSCDENNWPRSSQIIRTLIFLCNERAGHFRRQCGLAG